MAEPSVTVPNNLPSAVTSFVGRPQEMAQVRRLLRTSRLLTLTGPGGCGKTRLALQSCSDLLHRYPDGVWLIDLAALKDGSFLPAQVAAATGLPEPGGAPVPLALVEHLRAKRTLLVLDNCEHLIAACAALAIALLHGCPSLQLLCTSREPLGVQGETVLSVPPLATPDPTACLSSDELAGYESVALFAQRAAAALPGFALSAQNTEAVARICRHLDGMPLAIELAARLVRLLSPREIEARLSERFRLLTDGGRSGLPRHATLRAAIDWSYEGMSARERLLWRRLSVFCGTFTLEAVEGICAGEPIVDSEVLPLLAQLVDKSVVTVLHREDARRYRLLETLRQYGAERLQEAGETTAICHRHQQWFLARAERSRANLAGPEQALWLDRLEQEHDELRQAITWSLTQPGLAGDGLRLCVALGRFWDVRGHRSEGRSHLAHALALTAPQAPDTVRATALAHAGILAWRQGDLETASAHYAEALAVFRLLGQHRGVADLLCGLGTLKSSTGAPQEAEALYGEALKLYRDLDYSLGIAIVLNNLGDLSEYFGDYARAMTCYQESLLIKRQLGHTQSAAWTLMNLGYVELQAGDLVAAHTHLTESVARFREVGDKGGTGRAMIHLGSALEVRGDREGSRSCLEQGLAISEELGDKPGTATALYRMGVLARNDGDSAAATTLLRRSLALARQSYERGTANIVLELAVVMAVTHRPDLAARLLGLSESLRATGAPMSPPDRLRHDHAVASLRSTLGDTCLRSEWATGRAMTLDECLALTEPAPMLNPGQTADNRQLPLTNRERAIARLVAQGLSAKEIGARLYLSPRTVQKHEENIRSKLGLTNRAGLAAWAVANGVVTEAAGK